MRANEVAGSDGGAADAPIVAALRRREESAFAALVDRHHATLVRLAAMFVGDPATAEEVAQDTWLALLNGIDAFEERSSLRTWLTRVVVNRAKTRGARDRRMVAFSDLVARECALGDPAVPVDRFHGDGAAAPGHWRVPPGAWGADPGTELLAAETRQLVGEALAALPPAQREVMTLRDVEGWSADEVCNVLGISETNQRVLLHRARSKVRARLEAHFNDD